MGSKKKSRKHTLQKIASNSSVRARNLLNNDLGAIIFGCKNHTINECFSKELFGLPAQHFAYVKKISPGLPLFLFNYTDRKLHGIFEAASHGQLNIDPHAWTGGSVEHTKYPAQVQFNVRKRCQALTEDQFSPIISDNYYGRALFWFELDRIQTAKLVELFSSSSSSSSSSLPYHCQLHPPSIPTSEASTSVPQSKVCAVWGEASTSLPSSNAKRWSSLFKGGSTSAPVNEFENMKIVSSSSPLSEKSNEKWKVCGEERAKGDDAQLLLETLGHSVGGDPELSHILSKLVQNVALLMQRQIQQEEKIQALEKELGMRRKQEKKGSD